VDDSDYSAFPGLARLTPSRLLLVYRRGTDHAEGGVIEGRIGTQAGISVSWGSPFTIHDDADDVRCDDAVSVIGDNVVIAGRLYDAGVPTSFDPFVLVCDDAAAELTSASTWTHHAVAFSEGTVHNVPSGRVVAVAGGYALAVYSNVGAAFKVGVLLNDSLTDWSSPTYVAVTGTGYTEICLTPGPFGLHAYLRQEADKDIYRAISTDGGATWGSPALAFDGYGWPLVRRLSDGTLLAVYRLPPFLDTMWRTSADAGASWSSETLLDATGVVSVYASVVQLDPIHALCVYAVEGTPDTETAMYSQVFTRA
jgi:hypothetical protein